MNLLFAWLGGGLWIIPTILFLASCWCFYRGYKQWKSGSKGYVWKGNVPEFTEDNNKVPFFSIGSVIFGIIFFVATIAVLLLMYADR